MQLVVGHRRGGTGVGMVLVFRGCRTGVDARATGLGNEQDPIRCPDRCTSARSRHLKLGNRCSIATIPAD